MKTIRQGSTVYKVYSEKDEEKLVLVNEKHFDTVKALLAVQVPITSITRALVAVYDCSVKEAHEAIRAAQSVQTISGREVKNIDGPAKMYNRGIVIPRYGIVPNLQGENFKSVGREFLQRRADKNSIVLYLNEDNTYIGWDEINERIKPVEDN